MPLQDCEIVRIIFIRDNSRKVSSYFTFHDKTRVNYTIISDLGPKTYALTRRCPSRWAPQPCPSPPPPPQALRIYISVWITLDYQYGRHERRTRGNRASDSWREREKDGEKRRKRMDRGREMVEMAVLVGWSTTTTGGGVVEVDACGHCDPSERVNRKHKFNRFHPLLRALWRHRISH